jgi:multicomponent K+:H+ antiporter subunit C
LTLVALANASQRPPESRLSHGAWRSWYAIGLLSACGVYLMLRGRTFAVVLGLTLLSYAVNLFIFATGRLAVGSPPLAADGAATWADPLPQALVLTAIVIGFATTGFVLELGCAAETGTDHVDGAEPSQRADA